MILNNKNEIVGTWKSFDDMNDVTLSYNLAEFNNAQLEKVPTHYINRWNNWKRTQNKNSHWNNPIYC